MLQWLQSNWANLLVGGAVLAVVVITIVRMRARKKKTPYDCAGCGGGCAGCAHSGACRTEQ